MRINGKKRFLEKSAAVFLAAALVISSGCAKEVNEEAAAGPDKAEGSTMNSETVTAAQPLEGDWYQTAEAAEASIEWDSEDLSVPETSEQTAEFKEDEIVINGEGMKADGTVLTISKAGTYLLQGTLTDGSVVIDCGKDETVHLILNGVTIHSNSSAPIYCKQADKVVVTLAAGTENILEDSSREEAEDGPDAVLYSQDDLTINGEGSLVIKANDNDGIACKDDLKIVSGTIEVTSVDDGIVGRDLLAVRDGIIHVTSQGDAMKSTYDTDTTKGSIVLIDGSYVLTAQKDAIQSENGLYILNGSIEVISGGGAPEQSQQTASEAAPSEGKGFQGGGRGGEWDMDAAQSDGTEETADSTKGLKAVTMLCIKAGSLAVDSLDDALHCNGDIVIDGGTLQLSSGDDGIHADNTLAINSGSIDVTESYEGLEAVMISILDGDIRVKASDDGINAGSSENGETPMIYIKGGSVYVNASGDGIDSNGSVAMSGGKVQVDGPANSGNGALDYEKEFVVTGGTLFAAGASGMSQSVSESSVQPALEYTASSALEAGTRVTVKDAQGNVLADYTPAKAFQTVEYSSADLKEGTEYSIYVNDDKKVSITISKTVTYLNDSGETEKNSGMQGGQGGHGGGGMKPDGTGERPSRGENFTPGEGGMTVPSAGEQQPEV